MLKHTSESYAIESPRSENSWTESSSSCNSLSEFAFEMELPGMHGEGWLPSDLSTYDTGDAPCSQHHERDDDELPDLTWQRNSPKPVFGMKAESASKRNPHTTHWSSTVNTVNTVNEQRHASQAQKQSGQFTTEPICDELESWCAGCTPPPMMMKPMRSNTC